MDLSTLEPMTVICPRCQTEVQQRLYGPCTECVGQLYEKFPGVARVIESEDYVPKMNVTPNAVASKE